jgi:hypothetical protein
MYWDRGNGPVTVITLDSSWWSSLGFWTVETHLFGPVKYLRTERDLSIFDLLCIVIFFVEVGSVEKLPCDPHKEIWHISGKYQQLKKVTEKTLELLKTSRS